MKNYTLIFSKNGTLRIKQHIQLKDVYQELIKTPSTPADTKNIILYQLFNDKILNSYDQYTIQDKQIQLYRENKLINTIQPEQKTTETTEPTYTGIEKGMFKIGTFKDGITTTKTIENILQYLNNIKKPDIKQYFVNIEHEYYIIQKQAKNKYILTNTETSEKQEIKEVKKTINYDDYILN